MSLSHKIAAAQQKLQEHAIAAFLPNTEEGVLTFDTRSKFGGLPYLRNAKDWPVCPGCKKHMSFFLQLNLEETPIKYADNKGLLQVFYCTQDYDNDCETSNRNFEPFNEGVVLRKINIEGKSAEIKLSEREIIPYPEMVVSSWDEIDDYPHPEQFEELGMQYDEFEEDVIEALHEQGGIAMAGDKLGGWQHFLQSSEKIKDNKDGKEYVYLMQIDSEYNIPYMFGDSGIAFIGYHPDEPEKLAMFWQCY